MDDKAAAVHPGYARLFIEWFKIALFVVGGGYAIIVVADEVFGRKLKWLKEGELLEHISVISSVPGLIAGNSAIYVGLKTCGRAGAVVALAGVAMPSLAIFLAISVGFGFIPKDNFWIEGSFLGLRSAFSGVIAGTLWRTLTKKGTGLEGGTGIDPKPLSGRTFAIAAAALAVYAGAAAFIAFDSFLTFLKFGCVAIGGGFPLVPFYYSAFVGPEAPLLNLTPHDFSNLMALTQMTPGPVSLNAATFFGYRLNGIVGSIVASAALLTPSYLLMTAVLTGLERWRRNRFVGFLLKLLKPVSAILMAVAAYRFCALSVWGTLDGGAILFRPLALALAVFSAAMLVKRKMSIMALIFLCAIIGATGCLDWSQIKIAP